MAQRRLKMVDRSTPERRQFQTHDRRQCGASSEVPSVGVLLPISGVAIWVRLLPDRFKPSFVILTTRYSDAQPWASEYLDVKNYKWWLNGVWHKMLYSCTHMATVGVKGLKQAMNLAVISAVIRSLITRVSLWLRRWLTSMNIRLQSVISFVQCVFDSSVIVRVFQREVALH